jgi:drug/metabolite transporter (DMT)-like permease
VKTRRTSRRHFGTTAILGACLCVSVANIATKAVIEKVPVLPAVFVQILASTLVVWSIALATGRTPAPRRGLRLALPGVLQPGLAYIFSFLGLAITPVSIEGLLFAFEAALVAALAWPLLRERPSFGVLISIALGTAGVLLVSFPGKHELSAPVVGVLLIVGGVLCAALDTIVSRALAIDADPLSMTAASHVAGLTIVGAALLADDPQSWVFLADPKAMLLLVVSGILLHGVATILFNFALRMTPAAQAAALFPSISVFTTLGGYVFFGERLAPIQLFGGAMVISSALLIAWRERSQQ